MTQFLIRLFIRQPDHAQDPKVRAAYGNLAGWVGMACNLLLSLGKLTVGTLFGSIAILADALNNLSDASSNIVSLVGFKLASKAPDAEHPFGHARYEYLAGLVVSVTILGIGFSLLKESAVKVLHPTPVQFSWLTVGTLFGSIAIMADALNNLSDASSNVVSLVGFKLAGKAPDAEHPFGHARYEYLAGLVVSVTILGIGFSLLKESVVKVLHPTPVMFSWLTVAVLTASILVKLWMSGFNRTIGRIIGSETLIATAADSRNDVLSTGAVLIAAVLCRVTGWDVLDGLMGVGVAAFILISGWGLVMDTLSPLLGESPSEDLVDHIEQKVLSYPGVLGMHDLMVHDYGPGHQFASLHVELPAEQDPLEAHDLIDNIERDFLKNDRLMVTIHYDPIVTSDAAVGVLRARLTERLRQLDPNLSLHDLRIVPGRTHTNVLFDLVLPAGYAGDKVELLAQLEQFIKEQDAAYSCIIKVEQSYTAAHK